MVPDMATERRRCHIAGKDGKGGIGCYNLLLSTFFFEKNFSKDEYNSMLKRKFKPKEKLLNMYVFNNLKFKTK